MERGSQKAWRVADELVGCAREQVEKPLLVLRRDGEDVDQGDGQGGFRSFVCSG